MRRTFTATDGERWRVDTDEAQHGILRFTDVDWGPALIRLRRFVVRTVLVGGLVYVLLAVMGHERSTNDTLIALGCGLAAGAAQRWQRAQHETVTFTAPFPLRDHLNSDELDRAVHAAQRYRDHPDDTGAIELRASVARNIRQETG